MSKAKMPNWMQEYSGPERTALVRSALCMLGSELNIKLHLPEDAAAELAACVVDTREQCVAAMVSRARFYPTQDAAWQTKLENAGVAGKPWHLRAGWSSGNPHMLGTLQRGPTASTDPLVEPNELLVTNDGKTVRSRKWKAFLPEDLGVPSDQMKRVIQSMNGAHLIDPSSQVQITRAAGITFDHDELALPEDAHADLQGDFRLSAAATQRARELLLGRWQQLQDQQQ